MDVRLEDLKTRLHEFSEAQVSLVFYFFLKFFCHFEWDVADGNVGTWTIVIGHYLNSVDGSLLLISCSQNKLNMSL